MRAKAATNGTTGRAAPLAPLPRPHGSLRLGGGGSSRARAAAGAHLTVSTPAPSPRMSDIMPIRYMWSAQREVHGWGVHGRVIRPRRVGQRERVQRGVRRVGRLLERLLEQRPRIDRRSRGACVRVRSFPRAGDAAWGPDCPPRVLQTCSNCPCLVCARAPPWLTGYALRLLHVAPHPAGALGGLRACMCACACECVLEGGAVCPGAGSWRDVCAAALGMQRRARTAASPPPDPPLPQERALSFCSSIRKSMADFGLGTAAAAAAAPLSLPLEAPPGAGSDAPAPAAARVADIALLGAGVKPTATGAAAGAAPAAAARCRHAPTATGRAQRRQAASIHARRRRRSGVQQACQKSTATRECHSAPFRCPRPLCKRNWWVTRGNALIPGVIRIGSTCT